MLQKNIKLFYAVNFFQSLYFGIPIWSFFFTIYLNFSLGWAIFLSGFAGGMSFIFEIITGSWSDRIGRKKLYILGSFSLVISASFYLWATTIPLFLLSTVIFGFGYALISGNYEALIHDMLEEKNQLNRYKNIQANQYITLFTGRAIACIMSGFLFVISPLLPFLFTCIALVLGLILAIFIDEPKQTLSQSTNDIEHIKAGFNFLIQKKELLYCTVLGGIVITGFSNIYWMTYQPFLKENDFSIEMIGIIFGIISIFSAIGSFIVKKLQDKYNTFKIMRSIIFGLIIAGIGFILFKGYYIFISISIISILSGFIMSLGNTYVIHNSPKTHKATMLSIFSFSASLGYFIFTSPIGFLADIFTLEKVYFFIPFIILGVVIIDLIFFRKIGQGN